MDPYSGLENIPEPTIVGTVPAHKPKPATSDQSTQGRKYSPFQRLENLLARFSPAERLLLYGFSITLALSVVVLLISLNTAISTEIPSHGGVLVEGETGPARFINPVLAVSGADQDLSQLIYSGLMRALPDGRYVPDLAESYSISSDGTIYTFTLRQNLTFHDGTPLTANDVLYTVTTTQNPDFKSPHRADWEGVQVSSPDARTVVFSLPHAYAPFIEDTTLGILPKHVWQTVQSDSFPFSQLNTRPVGSGPYRIANVKMDSTGAPLRYDLMPFENYAIHSGYLSRISFVFFPNQETLAKAFNAGQIDALAGVSPAQLDAFKRGDASVLIAPLPRVFGIFFNQNHNSVLADASVREALEVALDKQAIVNTALHGFGVVLNSPIPPGVSSVVSPTQVTLAKSLRNVQVASSTQDFISLGAAALKRGGWSVSSSTQLWTKKTAKTATAAAGSQTVSLKLATADEPELVASANLVATQWRAAGIDVDVQVYPLSDFNNTVLRPRNYDAILFGEVVSRSGDLFAFWHSSQRNDPGLNLALYANSKADALLTKARASSNKDERDDLNAQFEQIIQKDRPAIFLYSPDFIYIVPAKIHGIEVGALSGASERFLNVYQWYADTERVWNFFAQNKDQ